MKLPIDEYLIDWIGFLNTSIEHKWNVRGTLLKIENSLMEVYGKEKQDFINEIILRLKKYLSFIQN